MNPALPAVTDELLRFDGVPVRRFWDTNLGWVVPAVDVSRAIGIDHNTVKQILYRNKKQFEAFSIVSYVTSLTSLTGYVRATCLSRDGVTMLLMKLQPDRMTDEDLAEKVSRFQIEVVRSFGAIIDGTVPSALSRVPPILEEQLQIAHLMSTHAGVDRGIAMSLAIAQTRKITGTDYLEPYEKFLLPGDAGASTSLNATDIGHAIGGIGPRETNALLEAMGFHQKLNGKWVVTEKGKPFFSPLPFSKAHTNGSIHSDIQNKWKPGVIDEIRGFQNRIGMPHPRSLFDTEWSS